MSTMLQTSLNWCFFSQHNHRTTFSGVRNIIVERCGVRTHSAKFQTHSFMCSQEYLQSEQTTACSSVSGLKSSKFIAPLCSKIPSSVFNSRTTTWTSTHTKMSFERTGGGYCAEGCSVLYERERKKWTMNTDVTLCVPQEAGLECLMTLDMAGCLHEWHKHNAS